MHFVEKFQNTGNPFRHSKMTKKKDEKKNNTEKKNPLNRERKREVYGSQKK